MELSPAGGCDSSDEQTYKVFAAELGLSAEEVAYAEQQLGRRPNRVELGMISAMWSEHCSYKSSRFHLKRLPTSGPNVLQGPGENAGVVAFSDQRAICFKIESHNHPSYIEPYQGAATGVGGILRDIFAMGARPLAFMNSLRFGDPAIARTKVLTRGVVKGIGGYGNSVGIPTVGGQVMFDRAYQGNILVNAFCVGVLDRAKLYSSSASTVGHRVIYLGSKTGRDGIHGASMASGELTEESLERRPTVQVGDPFIGKLLMEATLEILSKNIVSAVQDMGAAGLTCASAEMSAKGGVGMRINLDRVPAREEGMDAFEFLLSESQERMMVACSPDKVSEIEAIATRWGIDAVDIGQTVEGDRLVIEHRGHEVCDLPARLLADEAPLYERPMAPQQLDDIVVRVDLATVTVDNGSALLRTLLRRPNLGSRRWVFEQYDWNVGTNTVRGPGDDTAVMRIRGEQAGVAMVCTGNGTYSAAAPREAAKLAIAEAVRSLATVGARPLAVTNCLNFGNPEVPEVSWQLSETIDGMTEACEHFESPVISGNVSLYNQNEQIDIPPTPIIAMCGKLARAEQAITSRLSNSEPLTLYLLGHCGPSTQLSGEVGVVLGYFENGPQTSLGPCPTVDLDGEKRLAATVSALVEEGVLRHAHDCSEGGLAVALAEMTQGTELCGLDVRLPDSWRAIDLFCDEQGRIVVAVCTAKQAVLEERCTQDGLNFVKLGQSGGNRMLVNVGNVQAIDVDVNDIYKDRHHFFETL